MALFSSVEGFDNPQRRHWARGSRSPVVYEQEAGSEPAIETLLSQVP